MLPLVVTTSIIVLIARNTLDVDFRRRTILLPDVHEVDDVDKIVKGGPVAKRVVELVVFEPLGDEGDPLKIAVERSVVEFDLNECRGLQVSPPKAIDLHPRGTSFRHHNEVLRIDEVVDMGQVSILMGSSETDFELEEMKTTD